MTIMFIHACNIKQMSYFPKIFHVLFIFFLIDEESLERTISPFECAVRSVLKARANK